MADGERRTGIFFKQLPALGDLVAPPVGGVHERADVAQAVPTAARQADDQQAPHQ